VAGEDVEHSERMAAVEPAPRPVARRRLRALGVVPALRLLGWALGVGLEGLALAVSAPFSTRAALARRRASWRARSGRRLAATLGLLKGVFVKAGQFAAQRHDLVPREAGDALAGLRDRVPPLPLREIRPLVEDELGAELEVLFSRFDPEPLGAASMAQVHRARLPCGRDVAVKVQYPWLAESLEGDLALVRGLLAAWSRLPGYAGVDAPRLFAEFQAGLREELDFAREAAVATEIAANLAGDDRILVPPVIASHSSRRVLTMGFQPAVPFTDRAALARLGVAPREVVEIVARAYARQVFVDGLFHADPHPGNLFVIDEPEAARRPRVLFVDFGLSRRLDPQLRRELRAGLLALVQRDSDAFLAGMRRLGMIAAGADAGVRRSVEAMFARIAGQGGALGVAGSSVLALKDEAKALLRATDGLQLPNDLLLFAKTLSYVFSLGRELDTDVDLMRLCLPYALRFLAQPEA